MNLRRTYAVFLRQLYVLFGNPIRFVPLVIWVFIDIALWGFITKYLDAAVGGFNFFSTFLGAVLLWDILHRVQQGVTMPFLEDVWSKNFLNMFGSPLRLTEYLGGFILTSIFMSSIAFCAMLLFAWVFFGFSIFILGIHLVLFIFVLFLFGVTIGIFGAAVVFRFGPAAEWLVWPIPGVLAPFVGVFYPLSVLPGWMQFVGQLLPPAYVFEGMRSLLRDGYMSYDSLLWATLAGFLYIALAYAFFYYIYRLVLRNGLIARFEAEGP